MLISLVHRLIWVFFQPIVGFCTKQDVLNRPKILTLSEPVIFVSNHESHFDPFLISGATPCFGRFMPIRFFTRDIFFERPYFKKVLMTVGAFPGKIGYGLERAAEIPLEFINSGFSVGIFPEWCFPDEPEFSRMQSIPSYISIRCGAPVIPTFVYGIQGISWRKIFFLRKKTIISFGDPVYPDKKETLEKYTERINKGLLFARLQCIRHLRNQESKFWDSYAKFYKYLELARPYQNMLLSIRNLLPQQITGRWLDIGTGSGAMVQLLINRSAGHLKVVASDFNDEMLFRVRQRFQGNQVVEVKKIDLNSTLTGALGSFRGIIANLVLPYITHQDGEVGRPILSRIFSQLFDLLEPGGLLIFSTPKNGANFIFVALGSWRSFFDGEHPEYRLLAFKILRHALKIQEWGRRDVYNFLPLTEIEAMLYSIGYRDISVKVTLSRQVYAISCRKPNKSL